MKMTYLCLTIAALTVCLVAPGFGANDLRVRPRATYSGPEYLPGQIIVQFRPGVSETVIAQINEKNRAKVSYQSRLARFRVLTFPETIPPQAMVNIYANNPNVEYAELNHVRYAFGTPNDPFYGLQWHFDNAAYGGIDLARAWDRSTGSGVIVAVIDSGIRRGSDLMGTAFAAGHDFVNNDEDPTDDNGHGTHVAGTIAQSTNNNIGVAGIAHGCTLMAVKVLNASGSGSDVTVADGIRWAADNGADVINMSLGADAPSTTVEQAVNYAAGKGVTIVCASGNGARSTVSYPAAYPACIAVGATTYSEAVAWYSNGGTALDLTAPGGNNYLDENDDNWADGVLQQTFELDAQGAPAWAYYFMEGTSMAAPHVSGVAALLIAQGTYTTPAAIQNRLQSTAEDKGTAGWDSRYGWGIVNAYAALNGAAAPTLTSIAVTPAGATISVGDTQQYTATGTYSDSSTKNITSSVTWNSSAPAVAAISSSGLATGASAGTTNITASLGVASSPVVLTVTPATLTSLAVTPETATINKGGTQAFTATGTYANGSTKDITWSVIWSSDNTAVATLNSFGVAAGVGGGTAHITANSGSTFSNAATLTVNDVPAPGRILIVDNMGLRTQTRVTRKGTFVSAVAEVWIVDGTDGTGKPVKSATVTGNWSGAVSGTASKATNVNGLATLKSPEIKAPAGGSLTFVFTITSVQKTGYTYDDGGHPPSDTTTWTWP